MSNQKYFIWIDEEKFLNNENIIKKLDSFNIRYDIENNFEDGLKKIKQFEFQSIKIIIRDSLYKDFILKFSENLKDYSLIPKILIYSNDKESFIKKNYDINYMFNNSFYNYYGIQNSFEEVKSIILENKKIIKPNNKILLNNDENIFTFEYIDSIEKLYLPMYFQTLIKPSSTDNYNEFTKFLLREYSSNKEIKELINLLIPLDYIPNEILCKYYSKIYTFESDFYKNLNLSLLKNDNEKYLPYIKMMYEGIKLNVFESYNKTLYRGSKLKKDEIEQIYNIFREEKKQDLPHGIVFSKCFLSFTKEKDNALEFLEHEKKNQYDIDNKSDYNLVFFELETDSNFKKELSTHADIENFSDYDEKEVLFFPFSCFEIKSINENNSNFFDYKIILNYLGKYENKIEEIKKNGKINENILPITKFQSKFLQSFIVPSKEIKNINPIKLLNKVDEYKKEYKENKKKNLNIIQISQKKNNCIICIFQINENDLNKPIRILSCYEEYLKNNQKLDETEDEIKLKNQLEIENCEIFIKKNYNEEYKLIDFSYTYEFKNIGEYIIKFKYLNPLNNINYLFTDCKNLISIDLSSFDSENVYNMGKMFYMCLNLKNINFSNFNTEKVIDMSHLFCGCKSLENLNLSSFNTKNVQTMKYMFFNCEKIKYLDLSNFRNDSLTEKKMNFIFWECKGLKELNISGFYSERIFGKELKNLKCKIIKNKN